MRPTSPVCSQPSRSVSAVFSGWLQVAHEDVRALRAGSRPRARCATSVSGAATPTVPSLMRSRHAGRQAAILGLAVDLAHVDAEREVPFDQVGRDRRRAGAGAADAVHADRALDVVEHQEVGDAVARASAAARAVRPVELGLGDLAGRCRSPSGRRVRPIQVASFMRMAMPE